MGARGFGGEEDNMEKWRKLDFSEVSEINKVVGVFDVWFKHQGKNITIKIMETKEGQYFAVSSHSIHGPDQATPYQSIHIVDSIDEALHDGISGLCAFIPDDPEKLKETVWVDSGDKDS